MISVIIPYHHSIKLLCEVINNLCEGLDPNLFEIIIVNDGSVSSNGRFAPLKINRPNIKVINTTIQYGVGYSFDRGVEKASGDSIVLMGADVFVRQRSWLQDVVYATKAYPDTIGCAVGSGDMGRDRLVLGTELLYLLLYPVGSLGGDGGGYFGP